MTNHEWTFTASGPTLTVETCEKCGLVRIITMNGEHFFTRIDRQHAQCPSPYRKQAPGTLPENPNSVSDFPNPKKCP
jgi:hypothetical protein